MIDDVNTEQQGTTASKEKHHESAFFTTKPAEKTKPFHLLALAMNGLDYDNIIQRQESVGIQNRGSPIVK